jgi:hypothetical protein
MNFRNHFSILRLCSAILLFIVTSLPVFAQPEKDSGAADEPAAQGDSGLEFVPFRGVVVAAEQGTTGVSSIEIVNRGAQPFEITGIENSSTRFTAQVEAVEPGQRYRLTVTFDARGQGGKAAEWLHLATNRDRVSIPVHTEVIPGVYAFPRSVDMGKFKLSDIRGNPETTRTTAQILMVYRKNSTDFEIEVTSDIPFLEIDSEQGPQGDRWENTIRLDSEHVQPGDINGTIFIKTNDPAVPKLEVPVTGLLLDQ